VSLIHSLLLTLIVFRSHLADWWIVRYGVVIVTVVVVSGHIVVVIVHDVVVVVGIIGILVRLQKNYCCYSKMSIFLNVDAHRSQDLAYDNDCNS
jgi:hypothetical protein